VATAGPSAEDVSEERADDDEPGPYAGLGLVRALRFGTRLGFCRRRGRVGPVRDEEIVTAARAVLPRLPVLLVDEADEVGARLAGLLAGYDAGLAVVDDIVFLLSGYDETRRAMRRELDSAEGPGVSGGSGGPRISYSELPGLAEPASPIVYRCVTCGFAYPVFEVGEPVPSSCPDRHGPLVRAG
jgi:hypothetical protein